MALSRRGMLLAGAGLALVPAGVVAWRLIDAGARDSRLLAALADPASAARIGARIAEAARPAVRLDEAEARLAAFARDLPDDRDALRSAVRTRIAADFSAGRMVEVDGWQIAQTEADLALLAFAVSPPEAARPSGSG